MAHSFLDNWTMCPISYVIPSNSQLNIHIMIPKQNKLPLDSIEVHRVLFLVMQSGCRVEALCFNT